MALLDIQIHYTLLNRYKIIFVKHIQNLAIYTSDKEDLKNNNFRYEIFKNEMKQKYI